MNARSPWMAGMDSWKMPSTRVRQRIMGEPSGFASVARQLMKTSVDEPQMTVSGVQDEPVQPPALVWCQRILPVASSRQNRRAPQGMPSWSMVVEMKTLSPEAEAVAFMPFFGRVGSLKRHFS